MCKLFYVHVVHVQESGAAGDQNGDTAAPSLLSDRMYCRYCGGRDENFLFRGPVGQSKNLSNELKYLILSFL
jgi:hypothetical protein